MKAVRLDPKDIEYCATLEWNELMRFLKNKYGIEFQKRFQKNFEDKVGHEMEFIEKGKEEWK